MDFQVPDQQLSLAFQVVDPLFHLVQDLQLEVDRLIILVLQDSLVLQEDIHQDDHQVHHFLHLNHLLQDHREDQGRVFQPHLAALVLQVLRDTLLQARHNNQPLMVKVTQEDDQPGHNFQLLHQVHKANQVKDILLNHQLLVKLHPAHKDFQDNQELSSQDFPAVNQVTHQVHQAAMVRP